MNIILLEDKDFTSGNKTVVLKDRRYMHIKQILKSKPGDRVQVGRLNGKLGEGKIMTIDAKRVELIVKLNRNPPKPSKATLILALPRPIVLKRLLLQITTLGIKDIYLIQTNRVEKSYWHSPVLRPEKIRETLILGLEQAKDTVMPTVYLKKRFKPFVEDELSDIVGKKKCFVGHPGGLKTVSRPKKPFVLAIGPEGGLVPFEIEQLRKRGFSAIDGGVRILKVETAVAVLLTKLHL